MKSKISIIIPTYKFNNYLDKAIQSCLELDYIEPNIFVNINSDSKDFEQSLYWNNDKVKWRYKDIPTNKMYESWNDAIDNSYGEWIFLLSDDDILHNNFCKDIDINKFSPDSIYITRINIIDENSNFMSENKCYLQKEFTKEEILNSFFQNKIHNHLSLMLFSRKLYEKIGKFSFAGYPNGYYLDTVFHGKAFANCDLVYAAEEIVFSRRESSFQESAKFYFDKEVNDYFNIIVDAYFEDENFKKEALKRYGSRKAFYKKMIQDRFYTEWSKLNKPVYNKSFKKKIEFLYKHMRYWNTGIGFKIYSFLYLFIFKAIQMMPLTTKNKIKNLLGK